MITQSEDLAAVSDQDAWKLFVFRKSRESLSTRRLLAELQAEIQRLARGAGSVLDALVRAGEIETGLADAGPPETGRMAGVVDHLASMACANTAVDLSALQSLQPMNVPPAIPCSHPEGFSYYGLNPLDFADLARRIRPELQPRVAVVGIRSVGSTLGAIVAATLRAGGTRAARITVRPEGEPYHRRAKFSPEQQHWIRANLEQRADFVVVDEGPGFSGSTFLSVARALGEAGVPCSRIVLMGSRPFFARGAGGEPAGEWSRFRLYTIEYGTYTPAGAGRGLGDGAWRELLYPSARHWPACWVEQERIKHLSMDGQTFFKFEGFGRFGQLAREQAASLAQGRFSPRLLGFDRGYACYEFVRGRPLAANDLTRELLSRMAAYCAFRVRNFPAAASDLPMLSAMARVNLRIEFGIGKAGDDLRLEVPLERPVYPDCRMLPHEWLVTGDNRVVKTDAVGHGEGHQFPGPADIAWDLAGTIIEWGLSPPETEFFLDEYQRRSGDLAGKRLRPYLLLYTVLRAAQCRMASGSMGPRREARYLRRQYHRYAGKTKDLLEKHRVYD